jgi:hypothetical protein
MNVNFIVCSGFDFDFEDCWDWVGCVLVSKIQPAKVVFFWLWASGVLDMFEFCWKKRLREG